MPLIIEWAVEAAVVKIDSHGSSEPNGRRAERVALILQFAIKNVLELDDHGRAGVDLQSKHAADEAARIAVVQLAHGHAVDLQHHAPAVGNDSVVVPLGDVNCLEQLGSRMRCL